VSARGRGAPAGPRARPVPSVVRRFGAGREVVALGLRAQPLRDVYLWLLTSSWRRFFALVLAAYLGANAVFAVGYLALGDAIEAARPGHFGDAFFFSVQTMATIGYGKMAPRGLGANALVTLEALVGLLGLALVTGVVFAKFSRPTARVRFSAVAAVASFDGVPSLLFRMGNERGNQIAEASVHLVLLREERTAEGETVRRAHELRLRRDRSAFFALTWTVIHPITPDSPLHGETPESFAAKGSDLIVSLTGYDDAFAQTVHVRHAYAPDQVRWGERFVDVLTTLEDGRSAIDYRLFDETRPAGDAPRQDAPRPPRASASAP
jgi:inward rectifier potassium channel